MKNFKLILKSLFSNNATVEGARHRPWYFAVIIFFVSMILAIVPVFVTNISKRGDDVFKTYSYNMDTYTLRLTEELVDKDVSLVVSPNDQTKTNVLLNEGTKWNTAFSENPYYYEGSNFYFYAHKDASEAIDFQAFYLGAMPSSTLSDFAKNVESKYKDAEQKIPSLLLMTETQIVIYVCNVQTGGVLGSVIGDYQSSKVGWDMRELLSQKPHSTKEETAMYRAETWNNWKAYCNEIYNNNRLTSTWTTTLIMLAIDVVLVFFMGLMVFILTRGKNNPFRIYTFWESMKVGMWAANMPAILTCGFGFLFAGFMQVLFALLLGVRVMWLTMKTLGPNNIPTPSSNYKQVKTVDAKPSRK